MNEELYKSDLQKFAEKCVADGIEWYVTGSVSDVIQGVKIVPHDLDIVVHTRDFERAREIFKAQILVSSDEVSEMKNIQRSFQIRFDKAIVEVISDVARDAENRIYQKIR